MGTVIRQVTFPDVEVGESQENMDSTQLRQSKYLDSVREKKSNSFTKIPGINSEENIKD